MQRKSKLKSKHIFGIIKWILILIPALIMKIFIKNLWLIMEDDYEARDNGYWFFKYIKENHPKQKCIYVLYKSSVDYKKISALGKVITPHSFKHWFYYIVASKNITTQTGGKPCPAFTNRMERLGLFKTKTYFLQHGITYNDAKWLYFNKVKFKLFVTGATPETEFIKDNFGHPANVVKQLGFPRFDNLHNDITDNNMILVMPTWRNYINSKTNTIIDTAEGLDAQDFETSTYFKYWNEFLNSKELDNFLTNNNKTIYFYPHRNMQEFIDYFSTNSKNIVIAKRANEDVQDLLRKCSLLITDYSSVFFDVLYQNKPVICYQFDELEFRKGQYGKGYLDPNNTKLFDKVDSLSGLLTCLDKIKSNDFKMESNIKHEVSQFFGLRDNKNCERIFNEINKR